jgi:phage shock protein A
MMATPDQLRLWRIQYEELHKSMEKSREQFMAWSEEVAMVEGQNQTVDFRRCVAEIKQDIQRYRSIVKKLSKAAEFTDEEVENRSGNVSQLLDVV